MAIQPATAWFGEQQLASSDDVAYVEGNAYFPAAAYPPGLLTETATHTAFRWKGIAHYYTVSIGDTVLPDAARAYPHPSPLARRIKGRRGEPAAAFARYVEPEPGSTGAIRGPGC